MVAAGAAIAAFAAHVVDPASSSFVPRCPVAALTSFDCPGCGSGRALHALASGEWVSAFDLNALLPLALALFAYTWLAWTVRRVSSGPPRLPRLLQLRHAATVVLTSVVLFTVVRNLGFGPFRFLNSGVTW